MAAQLAAFDKAVRTFVDIKTCEGLAIVNFFEPEERLPCLLSAAIASAAGSRSAVPTAPVVDPLMYWLLRRWLTARYQEAVAAFMEDCCTFHELVTAHSRLKW
jgi:hypothetical protein